VTVPRRRFPDQRLRTVLRGGIIAAGVVLVLGLTGLLYVRSAVPTQDGTFRIDGVAAPVEVIRDEHGIPHVFARGIDDAIFAQGFLHARDRLWQMDLVRRAVGGRLAEVMGDDALETDRFMRTLGLQQAAAASLAGLTPTERRLLESYAAGVNAALDGWRGALPPEFLALRYRPEPWEPVHTMAVAKMMAFTLASYDEAVAAARAVRSLGPDQARHLFPDYPDWGGTILEPPEPADAPPLAAALIESFSIATASNAWVVSGERTASGRPILANDPHLQLQAPSLWYLMGLHSDAGVGQSGGLDVVGATIPGAPLVILGHNRAIAWGMTNAYVKDVDIFMERVDPEDPSRYLVAGGSEPFTLVTDTIQVRGRSAPVVMDVRWTRHGPVLPMAGDDPPGDTLLAVQWTAQRPTTVLSGILGLNLARDWNEFLAAAEAMDEPHQNLVYADTAGHIGYVLAGTVPLRGDRRSATTMVRPGWTGEWDWTGSLPFHEHPRALDPPAGLIVTANNRQTVEPVADLISQSWLLPFRAERIAEMIAAGDSALTADHMLRMQFDLVDLFARRYVDRAIAAASEADLPAAVRLLGEWDHRAAPHSRAASIFYVWSEVVRRAAASDLYRGDAGYFTREAAAQVLEQRALPWRPDGEEAYRAMAVGAMRHAVELVADRPWSALNQVIHAHPLGSVAALDRVLGLNLGPTPHYGAPHTVNVALWAFRSPAGDLPFTSDAGVSMRHVVDMGNLDGAGGFVIGTGQSGIPFSRQYTDQQELWSRGGLIPMPLSRAAVEGRGVQHMRIDPLDDRR
jgi:penicillin G amidase